MAGTGVNSKQVIFSCPTEFSHQCHLISQRSPSPGCLLTYHFLLRTSGSHTCEETATAKSKPEKKKGSLNAWQCRCWMYKHWTACVCCLEWSERLHFHAGAAIGFHSWQKPFLLCKPAVVAVAVNQVLFFFPSWDKWAIPAAVQVSALNSVLEKQYCICVKMDEEYKTSLV